MRLAVLAGGVADGTLQGAIQYAKDLEVDRLIVSPGLVPGFREQGYFELEALQKVKQEIEDAGLSFSVMQLWSPMVVGAPETEARLSGVCKSMEEMPVETCDKSRWLKATPSWPKHHGTWLMALGLISAGSTGSETSMSRRPLTVV